MPHICHNKKKEIISKKNENNRILLEFSVSYGYNFFYNAIKLVNGSVYKYKNINQKEYSFETCHDKTYLPKLYLTLVSMCKLNRISIFSTINHR